MRNSDQIALKDFNAFRDDTTRYWFFNSIQVGRSDLQRIDLALGRWQGAGDASSEARRGILQDIGSACKAWLDAHAEDGGDVANARRPHVTALLAQAVKYYKYLQFEHRKQSYPKGGEAAGPLKQLHGTYVFEADADQQAGHRQGLHTKGAVRPAASVFNAATFQPALTKAHEDGKISTASFGSLTADDYGVLEEMIRDQTALPSKMAYLSKVERLDCMVFVDADGKIKTNFDTPLDTGMVLTHYTIDRYGNIFIKRGQDYHWQHSSFNRGKEVICAGFVWVDQGVLTLIQNGSGHYRPTQQHLWAAVDLFRQYGATLDRATVLCWDDPPAELKVCGKHGAACPSKHKILRSQQWNSAAAFHQRKAPVKAVIDCKQNG